MAYGEDKKNGAMALYTSGLSCRQVATQCGLSADTVWKWRRQGNWDTQREATYSSRKAVRERIDELAAKKRLSESQLRALDRLTRIEERLTQQELKKKALDGKKAVKPKAVSEKRIGELYEKALSGDFGLYGYQKDFLSDKTRYRAVLKSRQIGFSYVMALDALLTAVSGMDAVIVSASQDQSEILIDYASQHAERLGIELSGKTARRLVVEGGRRVLARSANFRTVQGFSGALYLDEFAWVMNAEMIWNTAVPVIVAAKGRLSVCSTPYEKGNKFWQLMENEDISGGKLRLDTFSRYTINIEDAARGGLDIDIAEIRGLFDADSFRRLFMCEWFDDEESYFTFEEIRRCARGGCLTTVTDEVLHGGFDIGRLTDTSEIVLVTQGTWQEGATEGILDEDVKAGNVGRQAVIVRYMHSLRRVSFDAQKGYVREILQKYRVKELHVDATGLGMNLAEDLKREYPAIVKPLWFTRELKEELALNLKKLFEDSRIIIPNDPGLIAQIHSIKRVAKTGGFSYDSKRNAEIGHADKFWALALACRDMGFNKTRMLEVKVF
jgi:phage FluMu gp28-like protein/transposase